MVGANFNSFSTEACGLFDQKPVGRFRNSMAAFAAAALLHNDIHHSLVEARFPNDFQIGLIEGGNRLPDGSGWKNLLNGRPLPPTPLKGNWDPLGPPATRISV